MSVQFSYITLYVPLVQNESASSAGEDFSHYHCMHHTNIDYFLFIKAQILW